MISNVTPLVLVSNDDYWLPYALESVSGIFERMVIYDIGSQDRTREIIEWYVDKEKDTKFILEFLPMCEPIIQGRFRNSMIAEAATTFYQILDGDEVYPNKDLLINQLTLCTKREDQFKLDENKPFGVFNRIEFNSDLTKSYNKLRSHHRLYHRTAYWCGPHPGERSVISQNEKTEEWIPITMLHFHNTERSSGNDLEIVPNRLQRKSKQTYHPGELKPIDLLKEFPVLRTPIDRFPVCPALAKLQEKYHDSI